MVAEVPHSLRQSLPFSSKPLYLHQCLLILRVLLSMVCCMCSCGQAFHRDATGVNLSPSPPCPMLT